MNDLVISPDLWWATLVEFSRPSVNDKPFPVVDLFSCRTGLYVVKLTIRKHSSLASRYVQKPRVTTITTFYRRLSVKKALADAGPFILNRLMHGYTFFNEVCIIKVKICLNSLHSVFMEHFQLLNPCYLTKTWRALSRFDLSGTARLAT